MAEVGIRYFTYDGLNRRSSLKDEVGSVWYFDYDVNSNLTSQRNPLAAQRAWGYDADNRKTFQQDPLARTWYWTYDPAGNASSMKDGKAQVTYYQHDSVNLRHRVDYPDLVSHYFEFDVARQLTAMADPSGRTVESYDNFGRLTLRTNPGSQNLYYEYDAASNRTNLKDPDGKAIYYVYDSANRLEHVEAPDYSGTVAYYQYTLANERTFERKKNGVLSYYYFDNAGRISTIEHRGSGGIIEGWDFTRDEVGNILLQIRRTDSMRTYWNYDPANRITLDAWRSSGGSNVYGFAYSYDAVGNRNNKQKLLSGVVNTYWNYDSANQMTIQKSDATTTVYFTYDANGNLSVEHDVDAGAGRTYYEYDPRNLLSKIDFPQAIATNYFYYNAPGERIRKDDSTGGKKYTWDAFIPIVEKDLANSTTQRMVKGYTPVAGIGGFLLQDVGGTVIYPQKNQVGTTMRHTDGAQAIVNTYEYDAFGVAYVTSQGTAQGYRILGGEIDPDAVDFNSNNQRYAQSLYVPFRSSVLDLANANDLVGTPFPVAPLLTSFGQESKVSPPLDGTKLGVANDAVNGTDEAIAGEHWILAELHRDLRMAIFGIVGETNVFPIPGSEDNDFYTGIWTFAVGGRSHVRAPGTFFGGVEVIAGVDIAGNNGIKRGTNTFHDLIGSEEKPFDPLKTGVFPRFGIYGLTEFEQSPLERLRYGLELSGVGGLTASAQAKFKEFFDMVNISGQVSFTLIEPGMFPVNRGQAKIEVTLRDAFRLLPDDPFGLKITTWVQGLLGNPDIGLRLETSPFADTDKNIILSLTLTIPGSTEPPKRHQGPLPLGWENTDLSTYNLDLPTYLYYSKVQRDLKYGDWCK